MSTRIDEIQRDCSAQKLVSRASAYIRGFIPVGTLLVCGYDWIFWEGFSAASDQELFQGWSQLNMEIMRVESTHFISISYILYILYRIECTYMLGGFVFF